MSSLWLLRAFKWHVCIHEKKMATWCKICYAEKQKPPVVTVDVSIITFGQFAFKRRYSRNCWDSVDDCLWLQPTQFLKKTKEHVYFRIFFCWLMGWDKLVHREAGKIGLLNSSSSLFLLLSMIEYFSKYEIPQRIEGFRAQFISLVWVKSFLVISRERTNTSW